MQDERRDTDIRASSTRSVKPRSLPKSNGRRSRDREGYQEKKKTHVERVTPANYARRKFAPPCWTTVRGAQDAPNSNAAPDGSIRKTPCRARAYHAATGRTTINRGGGGIGKDYSNIENGQQGCRRLRSRLLRGVCTTSRVLGFRRKKPST
jgi:hypothetical protein